MNLLFIYELIVFSLFFSSTISQIIEVMAWNTKTQEKHGDKYNIHWHICMWMEMDCGLIVGNYCELWPLMVSVTWLKYMSTIDHVKQVFPLAGHSSAIIMQKEW